MTDNAARNVAVILLVSLMCSGCRGNVIVLGNLTSMVIAVALLWSTLRIND